MKRLFATVIFLALPGIPLLLAGSKQAVIGSHHDLSVTGAGPVTSGVSNACIFCHAPHNVLPNLTPLWDHKLSSQTYTTYTSSTYNSGSQTPSAGSSKLCLSCHDGTIAVGLTIAQGQIPTAGTMSAAAVFGNNLSSNHPVSMAPANDGQLAASLFGTPAATKDPAVKLVSGKVECVTCHDPHVPNNDPAVPMFLARRNSNGTLCLACHDPARAQPNALNGWGVSAHSTAANTVSPSVGAGSYGTVAVNACTSCHGTHENPVAARNLNGSEQAACSPCHGGANVSPALRNVMADFSKNYSHPTASISGSHDPTESLPLNTSRHAECPDCHNPHAAAAQSGAALPPNLPASLAGTSGYDGSGPQKPATREYQICMKCHADSTNKPQRSTYAAYGRTPSRYPQGSMPAGSTVSPAMPPDPYNVRLQFASTIGHNVMGASITTTTVPSLRAYMLNNDGTNNTSRPLSRTSQLYCTDCHSNDQARSANGPGANGPHGSAYQHLLQMNLYLEPAGGGSGNTASGYALCNKCHNMANMNAVHDKHKSYGCTTCHDPHGVIGGNAASNRAMINFDTAIVNKGTTYFGYYYNGTGAGQKGCYLNCHSQGHNPYTY